MIMASPTLRDQGCPLEEVPNHQSRTFSKKRRPSPPTISIPSGGVAICAGAPPVPFKLERDSSTPIMYSDHPTTTSEPTPAASSPQLDEAGWFSREDSVGQIPATLCFGIEVCPDTDTPAKKDTPCAMWSPMATTRSSPRLCTPTWAHGSAATPLYTDVRPWFLSPLARHSDQQSQWISGVRW